MRCAVLAIACLLGILAKDELLSVNVVSRHADRAGSSAFVTNHSSTVFFRGLGELSDAGIDNAYDQGRAFARRYVDSGFIDKRFLPNQVYVRSSASNRCLMTAASFCNALFQRTPKRHAVTPPIFTMAQADDGMLVPNYGCLDGWEDVVERFNLSTSENAVWTGVALIGETENPEECAEVPTDLSDALKAEAENALIRLPPAYRRCANGNLSSFLMKSLQLMAGTGINYNELRLKRMAGMLTNELLNNFNAVFNCSGEACDNGYKMRLYFTHDTTLVALAEIFGLMNAFEGNAPEFTSAFVFELRRNDSGPYVKIEIKNGYKAPFADTGNCETDCSLETLTKKVSPFAISEWIQCAN